MFYCKRHQEANKIKFKNRLQDPDFQERLWRRYIRYIVEGGFYIACYLSFYFRNSDLKKELVDQRITVYARVLISEYLDVNDLEKDYKRNFLNTKILQTLRIFKQSELSANCKDLVDFPNHIFCVEFFNAIRELIIEDEWAMAVIRASTCTPKDWINIMFYFIMTIGVIRFAIFVMHVVTVWPSIQANVSEFLDDQYKDCIIFLYHKKQALKSYVQSCGNKIIGFKPKHPIPSEEKDKIIKKKPLKY